MPGSETKWVKFGDIKNIAFLGKEVIGIASGIHVIFINLNTKDEKVEKFDGTGRGEGASCLAGHPVVPMFALAERCSKPSISIFTYPTIHKISVCTHNPPEKQERSHILSTAFGATDYLLSLHAYPDFKLIVWLWRTGEHLKTIKTEITDCIQQILCSTSSPLFIAQLGKDSGRMVVYQMDVCSKLISLTPHQTSSSAAVIQSVSWTYDGNLLLCDELGNVYLMQSDGKRRWLVVKTNLTEKPEHWKPLIGAFRGGVAIANSESRIVFYRKSCGERSKQLTPWKLVWQVETISHPIYLIRHPQRQSLLVHTKTGELVEISVGDDDVPRIQMICHQGCSYQFLMVVNPDNLQVAVVDDLDRLLVMDSFNGSLLGTLSLNSHGKVLHAVSHPALPIIATSTAPGRCNIVNVIDAQKPVLIESLFLINEPLDKMKFSRDEKMLVVANKSNGNLFIVDGFDEMNIRVKTFVKVSHQIVDFLIHNAKNGTSKFLILPKTHPVLYIGKHIIIYNLIDDFLEVESVIELPSVLKDLNYGQTPMIILSIPFLTKQIQVIDLADDLKYANLKDCISSSHRLRDARTAIFSSIFLTFSHDGLVIIRNKSNINQVLAMLFTHHRQEGGVKSAVICHHQYTIIISLGRNGNLVANQIPSHLMSAVPHVNNCLENSVHSILQTTPSFHGEFETSHESWVELQELEKLKREEEKMREKRAKILKDFVDLKKELKKILDNNELEEKNYRLPVEIFDLDVTARVKKIELNRVEQEKMREKFENEVYRREEVIEYIKKTFWDSLLVPACALISLDGNTRVNNFPLYRSSNEEKDDCSTDFKQLEASDEEYDENPYPSTTEIEFRRDDSENNEEDEEEKLALSGTTSYRWIHKDTANIVNQISRSGSYAEGVKINFFSRMREKKLKNHFNNLFESMRSQKEEQIKLAKAQIAKINHCSSELNEIFQLDYCVDFNWLHLKLNDTERPESVIKVEDEEVYKSINDFIDATNLDDMNNSTSLIVTATYKDTFRNEALQKMMGGVLEIRWEDEIKKDVEKPQCLLRDSDHYSDEDLEAIKKYEEAVRERNIERLKYKVILENEIVEAQKTLRDNIEGFNKSVEMFILTRIKMESAVLQENLMRLQESRRHQFRLQSVRQITDLQNNQLQLAAQEIKELTDDLPLLESIVNDSKNRYENLLKREKLLEAKFRGEFSDLKQPMVEHLLRHYKKRPRIGQLLCTSITYLTEVSKCILSREKPEILPSECLDFLKGMNSLDVMPSGLPSQIDSNHWFLLCKLRRNKVEIETRIKSAAVELAEAEQTLNNHCKSIQNAHSKAQQLKDSIEMFKQKNCEILQDIEIQLVLKMGQIETNLYGHPSEFENSVLLPFDQVFLVNSAIVEAGRKKLAAMNRMIIFRRTIQWKEWCYSCLYMTMNDFKEELKVLQDVKVTKEIQKYLMRNLHIAGSEKDMEAWERSVMSSKKRFHMMLENENLLLANITKHLNKWQKKNRKLSEAIEIAKLDTFKVSLEANDEKRARNERYRDAKLKAIMKRNRLITKVHNNYDDLLALRSQLELLRLKTYPTLRLKDSGRDRKKRKINA